MNYCPLCGQQTMPAFYGEAIKDASRKDTSGSSYWYKPVEENEHYCYYHKKIMSGECYPAILSNYPPDVQVKIHQRHQEYLEQFEEKKRRLNR